MVGCSSCGNQLSENELAKSDARMAIERALGGAEFSLFGNAYTPDLLSGTAMKCEGCGAWICAGCAERASLQVGAGMIQHTNCGGMFKNPS